MKKAFFSLVAFALWMATALGSFYTSDHLPPPEGMYVGRDSLRYANGLILSNIIHRRSTPNYPPPAPGTSVRQQFRSMLDFEFSTDDGKTYRHASAPATVLVQVTAPPATGLSAASIGPVTFDTELLALDIMGGTLPPAVMIRESPTLASVGKTMIQTVIGGFMIDSFFDIFTEVSVDGGETWSPSETSKHVMLQPDPTTFPPVITPTDLLPPPNYLYVTAERFQAAYNTAPGSVLLKNVRNEFFTSSRPPPPPGTSQLHEFASKMYFDVSTDGGQTFFPVEGNANALVQVTHRASLGTQEGTELLCWVLDTEMLQLNISGGNIPQGVMIRESPTLPSPGGTSVARLSDGEFRISSFFDIFTEITVNGGQTWVPATGPARVTLICLAPESPHPTPNLPPPDGKYTSPAGSSVAFQSGVVIKDVRNRAFTESMPPPPPGQSQVHQFQSQMDFMISMNGGQTFAPGSAPAFAEVMVSSRMDYLGTRYFDTEMLMLNIGGGPGLSILPQLMLRESPTRASLGRTSVRQDPLTRDYMISSFFDIFTELSLDGGRTWEPATTGSMTVFLMPTNPPPPPERDYFTYSQGKINLLIGTQVERVLVGGPTEVKVDIGPNGEASDADNDGLDDVRTRITGLNLMGNSSRGPVMVSLNPVRPTLGQIEEKTNGIRGVLDLDPFGNKGCANSFFDLEVVIKIGGLTLCPSAPLHIEAMICHKPPGPGEAYMNLVDQPPIELVDCASGQATGIFITGEMHTPEIPKEEDYFSYSQGKINLRIPGRPSERIIVAGPTRVQVCINDRDGLAADTDADGLDEVPTLMTELNLMGNSSLGPVMVSLNAAFLSKGEIEEKINGTPGVLDVDPFGNGGCGNSFFDLNVLIKVGQQVYHPAVPLHIAAMICHKPPLPGEAYMNLVDQEIQLLDENNNPTGIVITGEMHTPVIPKETDYFSYSQGKINIRHPNGQIERVIVAGPTEVQVCINDADGLAADTDADGLDQVPTEMTQLMLTGNSSLGPVMVMLDPNRPSRGEIEEKVNGTPGVLDLDPFGNKGCANSFFDVFARITVGNVVLCPAAPLHIEAMICHKPPLPGEAYMNLQTQEIPLLNCTNSQPTGFVLTGEMHTPNPEKEIDFFPASYAELDIRSPNGQVETVRLTGPSRVVVCLQPDGLAADTDGDGRDQVPAQMTQLDLSGVSSSLGPVQVRLDPSRPTLGEIEEQVNNTMGTLDVPPFTPTGRADSFFDVFAEFQVGAAVFHTAQPLRMQTVITHKPPAPGETYVNPFTQPVPILDTNGNPTGFFLVREIHTPNPTNCVSIMCPPDITVWSCSNSAVVNFNVQATNRCGANLTVVCVPPSGSAFPVGSTMVVCTASDGLGNTATCTFRVTVNADTEPPRLVCPSNIVVWTCSPNGVPVNFNVTATDDCDTNVTVTCTRTSGSVFAPGTNVVTCTARDDCGKTSTCAFTVTVIRDVEPPRLVCPSNIVVVSCADREQVFYNVTATDDCDPAVTVICDPPSGSFFPVGTTTVRCIAFDDCGHTNECRFTVKVGIELKIQHLPGGLVEICWPTNCPDFKLQCTHDFSKPILWLPVTNVVVNSNGMFCARVDSRAVNRFYRLIRYTPQQTFSPTDALPPTGAYKTPRGDAVVFFNGVQTRWFVDRIPPLPPPPIPPPCLTCQPLTMTFPTVIEFQYSRDEGRHFDNARASADATVRVTPAGGAGMTRLFDTELLSMNISGGNLPPGVMIRESPTVASLGRHTIRATDGGFFISSFFDIWLELSLDGGQTWSRSLCPAHVDYMSLPPENGSMTDRLPPEGSYDSPAGVTARYLNGVILRRIMHRIVPGGTTPKPPPCLTCPPDTQELQAMVSFEYSMDGGQTFMPGSAPGRTMVMVNHSEDTADASFFDVEILSMAITGGGGGLPAGVMIRESPSLPSLGFLSIRNSPSLSQPFLIGSFFDVWTELSADGGQTWSLSMDPTHVELVMP